MVGISLHLDLHQGCWFQENISNWDLGWCSDRILAQKISCWILQLHRLCVQDCLLCY